MNACLICSNVRVTLECASVVMELQGFDNSAEARKTILQVICQLLRVEWKSVEGILTKQEGRFLFCASCVKAMVKIILLREKLFQIETEIRDKLRNVEEALVTNWAESVNIYEAKLFKGVDPCTYEEFRVVFQYQAMQEIWNKQLIQKKILELNQPSNTSVPIVPSMVQLHLEKNVFDIADYPDRVNIKPLLFEAECPLTLESNFDMQDEFRLTCVSPADSKNSESGYVSPSKKPRGEDIQRQDTNSTTQNIFTESSLEVSSSKSNQKQPIWTSLHRSGPSVVKPCVLVKSAKASFAKRAPGKKDSVSTTQNNDMLPCSRTEIWSKNEFSKTMTKTNTDDSLQNSKQIGKQGFENDSDDNDNGGYDAWIEEDEKASSSSECDGDGAERDSASADDSNNDEPCQDTKESEEVPEPEISISELCRKHKFKPKHARTKEQQTVTSIQLEQVEATFTAKDKTKWTTQPPNANRQTRAYEVLREVGGLIGPAKNTKLTPVELFKLMIPPSIVEIIVKYTNAHAALVEKPTPGTKETWYPTTVDEIYAFMGIILYLGVENKRNVKIGEMWNSDERYGIPALVATMSRDRFQRLSSHLRFDDTASRKSCTTQSKETGDDTEMKLGYISEILNPFIDVMQSHLRPYDTLVVDEMLVKFRGHSKFRVYMKSKPGKYGFKFWAVCDVETGYILKIALYHGKVGKTVTKELGKKVVLELVKKYFNTGRAVTIDNFFTSKALGEELIKKKMSMLGTLNRNKMDIIPAFINSNGRPAESSIFAFQGDFTMVSYMQRRKRPVLLLSTQHHLPEICPGIKQKPLMILDYNATKGGVDTADGMIATYCCQRTTNRWPVKIFYALLDIAALNAYSVHKLHDSLDPDHAHIKDRRYFLRSIADGLMDPIIEKRAQSRQRTCGVVFKALLKIGYENRIEPPLNTGQLGEQVRSQRVKLRTQGLCVTCSSSELKIKRRSKTACHKCLEPMCAAHQNHTILCDVCTNLLT